MDRDRFWSIDKLIPRIGGVSSSSFERKNEQVLIRDLVADAEGERFGPCISPKFSKVIRLYQLTKLHQPGHDLILGKTEPYQNAPFVPCTAFSPSYLSLRNDQRASFFSFCHSVSKRKKVETSFPYIQLYLCRIIRQNLFISPLPEDFFWLWSTYRRDFPVIDKLFSDTLSDFCLISQTVPDYERLTEIVTEPSFSVRPFLLDPYIFDYLFSPDHTLSGKEMNLVLRMLTGESFRKSKAYRVNSIFASASEDAIQKAIKMGLFNRKDLNDSLFRIQIPSEVRTERKLFPGLPRDEIPSGYISLCYVPLLHDENIRSRVDEIVRYLENRLRKILKMKNSLSRIHIANEHRAFLDGILMEFEGLAPKENQDDVTERPISVPHPTLPRDLQIDFADAAQIEEDSWNLTQTLTEAYSADAGECVIIGGTNEDEHFDEEYRDSFRLLETNQAVSTGQDFWEFAGLLEEKEDTFMRVAVNHGRDAARQFAAAGGLFFEALIAACNQKAQSATDDSIFDGAGNLFEDYIEALKEVFPPMEGEAK